MRSRVTVGVALIVVGLGLYAMRAFPELGQSLTLALLGVLCIGGYLYSRAYLLLVAGGVMSGLAIGSFGERWIYVVGEFSYIGLGVGFVMIFLIGLLYERRSNWWPLIPGAVLLLLGFRSWHRFYSFLLSDGWPLILVIAGGLILLGSIRRRQRGKTSA